jgi:Flp pilus assembly pilin Flp
MLTFLKAWFATRVAPHLPKDEKGQDGAEYGLLVALIAVIITVGVLAFGTQLNAFFVGLGAALGL